MTHIVSRWLSLAVVVAGLPGCAHLSKSTDESESRFGFLRRDESNREEPPEQVARRAKLRPDLNLPYTD